MDVDGHAHSNPRKRSQGSLLSSGRVKQALLDETGLKSKQVSLIPKPNTPQSRNPRQEEEGNAL